MHRLPAVAALLAGLLAVPAAAETRSYTWVPRTEEGAQALSRAIARRSLRAHLGGGGTLRDWVRDRQDGGSLAVVVQRGEGHEARLDQAGPGNAHAIVQLGRGAVAAIDQDGGELGLTIQHGR